MLWDTEDVDTSRRGCGRFVHQRFKKLSAPPHPHVPTSIAWSTVTSQQLTGEGNGSHRRWFWTPDAGFCSERGHNICPGFSPVAISTVTTQQPERSRLLVSPLTFVSASHLSPGGFANVGFLLAIIQLLILWLHRNMQRMLTNRSSFHPYGQMFSRSWRYFDRIVNVTSVWDILKTC